MWTQYGTGQQPEGESEGKWTKSSTQKKLLWMLCANQKVAPHSEKAPEFEKWI
jgi:hypothetical protein